MIKKGSINFLPKHWSRKFPLHVSASVRKKEIAIPKLEAVLSTESQKPTGAKIERGKLKVSLDILINFQLF